MQLIELYQQFIQHYPILNPHAETWELWIKLNKSLSELFKVAIGTILVQNTNWRNVDHAIANLKNVGINSFEQFQKMELKQIKELIKPAGFFNQKATSLQILSTLLLTQQLQMTPPSRQQLLDCKGIGKETADSILLYCFQKAIPVVGTYTRRVFARIRGDVNYLTTTYETIQKEQCKELPQDPEILGRFHALIICHGQNCCQKNTPKCLDCFLQEKCMYGQNHEIDPTIAQIQTLINPPKRKKG